jgi:hypothetical protein
VDFKDIVITDIRTPLEQLCELLLSEGELDQSVFFRSVLDMLAEPGDEASVIAAAIELSKCAFLGFEYSFVAQTQINLILDKAIVISTMMSESRAH